MKTQVEVIAQIRTRIARTWSEDVASLETSWPHQISLGAPPVAVMEKAWGPVHTWATGWSAWAAQHGLELVTKEFRVARTQQSVPTHIIVPSVQAAATLAGAEWPANLTRALARKIVLASRFPSVDIARVLRESSGESDTDFNLVLRAAEWFRDNDATGLTPRQVPIVGLHSKWLNTRKRLVLLLSGQDTLGLEGRPQIVHFTYLDPMHRAAGGRVHDSATVGDATVPAYTPRTIVICENKDTVLYFPAFPGTIAIQGGGFTGAPAIASLPWVRECPNLVYWGDIDAAGFQIVNRFRSTGLKIRTVLMDQQTYESFSQYGVYEDEKGRDLRGVKREELKHLTEEEELTYFDLTDPGWIGPRRIEQERLPYPDIEDSGRTTVNMSASEVDRLNGPRFSGKIGR